MSERIDWATTEDCPLCTEVDRDLHTAWHRFAAAYLYSLRIPQMVAWLARRLG